ncbi:MAG TPA: M23 family metallopeptidase [Microbacterium sp.]|nr:M23 family metallopeptidase [Microbacterium sp.]
MRLILRIGAGLAASSLVLALGPVTAAPAEASLAEAGQPAQPEPWVWPVDAPFRVSERFAAPAHDYAPGHRGIDLEPSGNTDVRAPADGVVAFSGDVAGRGIVTIDHGRGLVTTLEPVESELAEGAAVSQSDSVGALSVGGHAVPGTVHFGVRLDGRYINPLLLLGGVPRAVLVPCCEPL